MSILTGNQMRSRVSSTLYDTDNPLVGSGPQDDTYKPRTTTAVWFNLGIAADGVVDLGIELRSTLDADMSATLDVMLNDRGSRSSGQTLWKADIPADGRILWLPERSTHENGYPLQRVYEVTELRMPINEIRLKLTPKTAPTTGELLMRLVRRY